MKDENPVRKLFLYTRACGLHTVNGAVKTGLAATDWQIFHLLKNSPVRHPKYKKNYPDHQLSQRNSLLYDD